MIAQSTVDKINSGRFSEVEYDEVLLEFAREVSSKADGLFTKKEKKDDYMIDYYKVETVRFFLGFAPVVFYANLRWNSELREILSLRVLKEFSNYEDFKKRLDKAKLRLDNMVKRNIQEKDFELYAHDSFIVPVDLNRIRSGKKVKEGAYDAEYCYDSLNGVTPGFMVHTLINLSNFSVVACEIHPKSKPKKEIWSEMVTNNLGSVNGKIKVVIADAGFFAYDNILLPLNQRVIPVIKARSSIDKDKLKRMIENQAMNLLWFDSRYNQVLDHLQEDFEFIIQKAVEGVDSYQEFAGERYKIELFFKVGKALFGLKDLHCYYRKYAITDVKMILYSAQLFCQLCVKYRINIDRFVERVRRRRI